MDDWVLVGCIASAWGWGGGASDCVGLPLADWLMHLKTLVLIESVCINAKANCEQFLYNINSLFKKITTTTIKILLHY